MTMKSELSELTANITAHKNELIERLKMYDLCKLGEQMQDAQCADIYNQVLASNEFYAREAMGYRGWEGEPKAGERITNNEWSFMLTRPDFDKLMNLALPLMIEAKITDENGRYIERWTEKKINARQELINLIIDHILPESMKTNFAVARYNVVVMDKLIRITRDAITKNN